MKSPRVSAMDLHDPLPQFKGQLDAVVFHGLLALPDTPAPLEGASDTTWNMLKLMFRMMTGGMKDPADELWIHHVASGTVIGGENLGWMYPAADLAKQGGMLKNMIKPDQVYVFTDARKVADPRVVSECWQAICAWPARTVMTYHDWPGFAVQQGAHEALKGAVGAAKQL
jgi:hypothetical protein